MKVLTTIDLLALPSLETPPTGYVAFGAKADGLYQKVGTVETKLSIDGHVHAAASTSVAGFLSAADKVKLDGIATGATANTGTVTSVAMTVPTGLTVAGSPITTSGTLALSLTSGYSIPTTAKQTQWDTAYTHSQATGNPHATTFAQIGSKPTTLAGYGITDAILFDDVIQNTNPFGGRKLYINSIDNVLAGASKKYYVTVTKHKKVVNTITYPKPINAGNILLPQWEDSPVVANYGSDSLFDNIYEGGIACASDEYLKVALDFNADGTAYFNGYPYGTYLLSYYSTNTPEKAEVRYYNGYAGHTIGYKTFQFSDFIGTGAVNYVQKCDDYGNYQRREVEFIIYGHPSHVTTLTEIEWKLARPSFPSNTPIFTNHGWNKAYFPFYLGDQTTNRITLNPNDGNVTALSFTGDLSGNATTATTLQTARTIAISGGATGTATSFNGSADITIPVTSLDASKITTGTVPDARLTGVYTGFTHRIDGANTIFTTPSTGSTAVTGRTVYGLAEYRSGSSSQVGAIVFIAPFGVTSTMMQFTIKGMEYTRNVIDFTAQCYNYSAATWANLFKVNRGEADVPVRFGYNADGKFCIIVGDTTTSWSYPHLTIVEAMLSHSITDAQCYGWSTGVVTDLSTFTNVTLLTNSSIVTDITGTATSLGRSVLAGNGLTGGGALSADVTLTMGTPSTLTAASTNAVTATSHTHAITTTAVGAASTIVQTDANGAIGTSRFGTYGVYSAAQTQGVWGMGSAYMVNATTTGLGTLYGLGYSYISVGGSSFANEHQIHFVAAGTATASISLSTGKVKANTFIGALTGNADTATSLSSVRTFAATGDATGSVSSNLSAGFSMALTLANSGVTAGTYRSVTVDAKGRVTDGTNPTTVAGYGLTDAVTTNTAQTISGEKTFSAALTASVSVTTPKVIFAAAGWSVEQSGTEIQFKYNGVIKQRLLSDGGIVGIGEVTAFGAAT